MRLVFAGTPHAATPSLDALARAEGGHEVATVITRADAPLGRRRVLTPSPVAERAGELGLPVLKANRLDPETSERIAALQPDLGVIVAYGALVREPLLSTPRHGWINLHFSLLPRWRGAAPVQHAIIAGDAETGACVFQLVPELDAGDLFGATEHPIGCHESAGDVLDVLAERGADLVRTVVGQIASGTAIATAQAGAVTLAPKVTIEDARIRWHDSATAVDARIRGVTPEPGAFTDIGHGRLKVHAARIATDAEPLLAGSIARVGSRVLVGSATDPIELVIVQPAGKTRMAAADWWRGLAAHPPGAR